MVGNGNYTSLWYDNWLGPFISKFGNSFISASGLGEEAKVGAIIEGEGGDWNWPSGSSEWDEIISAMPSD